MLYRGGVNVFDLVVNRKDSSRNNSSYVTGVAVAAGNVIKVYKEIVEITLGRMNVYVVNVALRAVEEDAARVVDCLLNG